MARKPVHLTMSPDKVTGRQAIWQAIREARRFTLNGLWHATALERATVRTYLLSLEKSGHVVRVGAQETVRRAFRSTGRNPNREAVYELVKDAGIEAPRVRRDGSVCTQGAAREQMWRSMKMFGGDFSFRDLAILATTDTVEVKEADARDYVKHLFHAGYLAVCQKSTPRSPARYRFIRARDTGPRPPMVQRLKTVFDTNLCRTVWQEKGGEE